MAELLFKTLAARQVPFISVAAPLCFHNVSTLDATRLGRILNSPTITYNSCYKKQSVLTHPTQKRTVRSTAKDSVHISVRRNR